MQQSTLAGSRWRNDRYHLTLPQTQVCIRQNGDAFLAAAIRFLQAARFQNDGRAGQSLCRYAARELCVLGHLDRKSTRLNSSHLVISYAVFCLKKKML